MSSSNRNSKQRENEEQEEEDQSLQQQYSDSDQNGQNDDQDQDDDEYSDDDGNNQSQYSESEYNSSSRGQPYTPPSIEVENGINSQQKRRSTNSQQPVESDRSKNEFQKQKQQGENKSEPSNKMINNNINKQSKNSSEDSSHRQQQFLGLMDDMFNKRRDQRLFKKSVINKLKINTENEQKRDEWGNPIRSNIEMSSRDNGKSNNQEESDQEEEDEDQQEENEKKIKQLPSPVKKKKAKPFVFNEQDILGEKEFEVEKENEQTAKTGRGRHANFNQEREKIKKQMLQLYQQKKQEVENLSKDLGVDLLREQDRFLELLYEMISQELPQKWVKEMGPDQDTIVYYDQDLQVSQKYHPYKEQLLLVFNEIQEKVFNSECNNEEIIKLIPPRELKLLQQQQQQQDRNSKNKSIMGNMKSNASISMQRQQSNRNQSIKKSQVSQINAGPARPSQRNNQQQQQNNQQQGNISNQSSVNNNQTRDRGTSQAQQQQKSKQNSKQKSSKKSNQQDKSMISSNDTNNNKGGVQEFKYEQFKDDFEFFQEQFQRDIQTKKDEQQKNMRRQLRSQQSQKTKNVIKSSSKIKLSKQQQSKIMEDTNTAVKKQMEQQQQLQGNDVEETLFSSMEGGNYQRFQNYQGYLQKIHQERNQTIQEYYKKEVMTQQGKTINEYEYIHKTAADYYVQKYGLDYIQLKNMLENSSYEYRHADPDEVVNAIVFLNIHSNETQLYWAGRAMLAMELPEGWESHFVNNDLGEIYIYKPLHFKLNIHPSFLFIKLIIQQQKYQEQFQKLESQDEQGYQMVFLDKLNREHELELKELVIQKEMAIQNNPEIDIHQAANNYVMQYIQTIQQEEMDKIKQKKPKKFKKLLNKKQQLQQQQEQQQKDIPSSHSNMGNTSNFIRDSNKKLSILQNKQQMVSNSKITVANRNSVLTIGQKGDYNEDNEGSNDSEKASQQSDSNNNSSGGSGSSQSSSLEGSSKEQDPATNFLTFEKDQQQKMKKSQNIALVDQNKQRDFQKLLGLSILKSNSIFKNTLQQVDSSKEVQQQQQEEEENKAKQLKQQQCMFEFFGQQFSQNNQIVLKDIDKYLMNNHEHVQKKVVHQRQPSYLSDQHFIHLSNMFNLQLPQQVHNFALIGEFLMFREQKDGDKYFRYRKDRDTGQVYYISNDKMEVKKEFPYFQQLQDLIQFYNKVIEREKMNLKVKKHVVQQILHMFDQNSEPTQIFDALRVEAKLFVQDFIAGKFKNSENLYNMDANFYQEMIKREQVLNNEQIQKKIRFKGEKYQLSQVFKQLRNQEINEQLNDYKIKKNCLFYFPYKFSLDKKGKKNKEQSSSDSTFKENERVIPKSYEIFIERQFFQQDFEYDKYNLDIASDQFLENSTDESSNSSSYSRDGFDLDSSNSLSERDSYEALEEEIQQRAQKEKDRNKDNDNQDKKLVSLSNIQVDVDDLQEYQELFKEDQETFDQLNKNIREKSKVIQQQKQLLDNKERKNKDGKQQFSFILDNTFNSTEQNILNNISGVQNNSNNNNEGVNTSNISRNSQQMDFNQLLEVMQQEYLAINQANNNNDQQQQNNSFKNRMALINLQKSYMQKVRHWSKDKTPEEKKQKFDELEVFIKKLNMTAKKQSLQGQEGEQEEQTKQQEEEEQIQVSSQLDSAQQQQQQSSDNNSNVLQELEEEKLEEEEKQEDQDQDFQVEQQNSQEEQEEEEEEDGDQQESIQNIKDKSLVSISVLAEEKSQSASSDSSYLSEKFMKKQRQKVKKQFQTKKKQIKKKIEKQQVTNQQQQQIQLKSQAVISIKNNSSSSQLNIPQKRSVQNNNTQGVDAKSPMIRKSQLQSDFQQQQLASPTTTKQNTTRQSNNNKKSQIKQKQKDTSSSIVQQQQQQQEQEFQQYEQKSKIKISIQMEQSPAGEQQQQQKLVQQKQRNNNNSSNIQPKKQQKVVKQQQQISVRPNVSLSKQQNNQLEQQKNNNNISINSPSPSKVKQQQQQQQQKDQQLQQQQQVDQEQQQQQELQQQQILQDKKNLYRNNRRQQQNNNTNMLTVIEMAENNNNKKNKPLKKQNNNQNILQQEEEGKKKVEEEADDQMDEWLQQMKEELLKEEEEQETEEDKQKRLEEQEKSKKEQQLLGKIRAMKMEKLKQEEMEKQQIKKKQEEFQEKIRKMEQLKMERKQKKQQEKGLMRKLFTGYNDNIQKSEQIKKEKEKEQEQWEYMIKKENIDVEIDKLRQNYLTMVSNDDGSQKSQKQKQKAMSLMNKLIEVQEEYKREELENQEYDYDLGIYIQKGQKKNTVIQEQQEEQQQQGNNQESNDVKEQQGQEQKDQQDQQEQEEQKKKIDIQKNNINEYKKIKAMQKQSNQSIIQAPGNELMKGSFKGLKSQNSFGSASKLQMQQKEQQQDGDSNNDQQEGSLEDSVSNSSDYGEIQTRKREKTTFYQNQNKLQLIEKLEKLKKEQFNMNSEAEKANFSNLRLQEKRKHQVDDNFVINEEQEEYQNDIQLEMKDMKMLEKKQKKKYKKMDILNLQIKNIEQNQIKLKSVQEILAKQEAFIQKDVRLLLQLQYIAPIKSCENYTFDENFQANNQEDDEFPQNQLQREQSEKQQHHIHQREENIIQNQNHDHLIQQQDKYDGSNQYQVDKQQQSNKQNNQQQQQQQQQQQGGLNKLKFAKNMAQQQFQQVDKLKEGTPKGGAQKMQRQESQKFNQTNTSKIVKQQQQQQNNNIRPQQQSIHGKDQKKWGTVLQKGKKKKTTKRRKKQDSESDSDSESSDLANNNNNESDSNDEKENEGFVWVQNNENVDIRVDKNKQNRQQQKQQNNNNRNNSQGGSNSDLQNQSNQSGFQENNNLNKEILELQNKIKQYSDSGSSRIISHENEEDDEENKVNVKEVLQTYWVPYGRKRIGIVAKNQDLKRKRELQDTHNLYKKEVRNQVVNDIAMGNMLDEQQEQNSQVLNTLKQNERSLNNSQFLPPLTGSPRAIPTSRNQFTRQVSSMSPNRNNNINNSLNTTFTSKMANIQKQQQNIQNLIQKRDQSLTRFDSRQTLSSQQQQQLQQQNNLSTQSTLFQQQSSSMMQNSIRVIKVKKPQNYQMKKMDDAEQLYSRSQRLPRISQSPSKFYNDQNQFRNFLQKQNNIILQQQQQQQQQSNTSNLSLNNNSSILISHQNNQAMYSKFKVKKQQYPSKQQQQQEQLFVVKQQSQNKDNILENIQKDVMIQDKIAYDIQVQINEQDEEAQDYFSKFRIFKLLERVVKGNQRVRFSLDSRVKNQDQQGVIQNYKEQSIAQLKYLQAKFILKKIDLIIYEFLHQEVEMDGQVRRNMQSSNTIKAKFYENHKEVFKIFRRVFMQNQHVKNDVLVLMHNKLLPQKIKSEVVDSFRDFYQENICQINQEDVLKPMIVIKQSLEMTDMKDSKKYQQQYQHNPFKQIFSVLQTKLFYEGYFQMKENKKIQKQQEYEEMSEYSQEIKRKQSQQQKQIQDYYEAQFQNKDFGEVSDEENDSVMPESEEDSYYDSQQDQDNSNNQSENNGKMSKQTKFSQQQDEESMDSVQLKELKEDQKYQRYIKKHYRTEQFLFLYMDFIQFIEYVEQQRKQNFMLKFMVHELGDFHKVNSQYVQRYEIYTDFGLTPLHVVKMCSRLRINIQEEGDLVWIAYYYCGFLQKYNSQNTQKLLESVIKSKQYLIYDEYFFLLLDFKRIIRQFILKQLTNGKDRQYKKLSAYLKFLGTQQQQQLQYKQQFQQEKEHNHLCLCYVNIVDYFQNYRKKGPEFIFKLKYSDQDKLLNYQRIEKNVLMEILEGLYQIIQQEDQQQQQKKGNKRLRFTDYKGQKYDPEKSLLEMEKLNEEHILKTYYGGNIEAKKQAEFLREKEFDLPSQSVIQSSSKSSLNQSQEEFLQVLTGKRESSVLQLGYKDQHQYNRFLDQLENFYDTKEQFRENYMKKIKQPLQKTHRQKSPTKKK